MTALSAPVPGQTLGPFKLESVVGVGGMGIVYRAFDASRGVHVALKVLRSRDGTPPRDEDRARFVREARLASGLSHPNIVAIHASGAIGTMPYIAMEWIEGASLAARMDDLTLSVEPRLDVLVGIAEALAYAHAQGVVHRDLKPSNVMLDVRGMPKLVDFGIAKQARDGAQPFALAHTEAGVPIATRTGVLLGTPSYMAPEQMISPEVDARVDQFAWGVLAYELLAGIHPRQTVAEGDAAFPVGRPRPLAWQSPGVSEAVAAVVHRAMAYERDARFSSMTELVATLRAARAMGAMPPQPYVPPTGPAYFTPNVPMPTLTNDPPTTMGGLAARVAPTPGFVTSSGPSPGRVLAFAFGGAALLGLVGIAVGAMYVSSGPAPTLPPVPALTSVELTEGLEGLAFVGGNAGTEQARAELLRQVSPCIDARMLPDDEISLDATLLPNGRVHDARELNYCRRHAGNHFFCTNLGDPVKKGHPTPPGGMLECVRDKTNEVVLPALAPRRTERWEPAEMPEETEIHLSFGWR